MHHKCKQPRNLRYTAHPNAHHSKRELLALIKKTIHRAHRLLFNYVQHRFSHPAEYERCCGTEIPQHKQCKTCCEICAIGHGDYSIDANLSIVRRKATWSATCCLIQCAHGGTSQHHPQVGQHLDLTAPKRHLTIGCVHQNPRSLRICNVDFRKRGYF